MSRRANVASSWWSALAAIALACSAGCGAPAPNSENAGRADGTSSAAPAATAEAELPGLNTPATGAEAAATLDLSEFPLAPGADEPGRRCIGRLTYRTSSTVAAAYAFCKAEFAKRKWRELAGSYESPESSNATFARSGFVVSLSASNFGGEGKPTNVFIVNLGNAALNKLPTPAGAKNLYDFPASVGYVAIDDAPTTADAVAKLLADEGWVPYGSAGDSRYYKQNAVQLTATVNVAPAQDAKTMIVYSSEQLSEDLPAPADAISVHYSEPPTQLAVDFKGDVAAADAWYRGAALGKLGWDPTTELPIKDKNESWVIYRRKDQAMLEIHFREVDDLTRLAVEYTTPKEFAEMEARFEEEKKKGEETKGAAEKSP